VILADEISPDGCCLWDMTTGEKLDKDRFRRDLGGGKAHQEVARRLPARYRQRPEREVLDLSAPPQLRGSRRALPRS
jgi:phosphoribosylaminoimidazole-succinocarboxamide synthase